ncbi:MAG: sigma-70 family RNA polymerase sigma factor [bacterium]|nr:sigma-70 family RNA polymerase sigma factor [bacterium]
MSEAEIRAELARLRQGRDGALANLVRLLYPRLQALARSVKNGGGPPGQLGTTSVVHEAYLKLVDGAAFCPEDKQHFMAVAAKTMRQVLVDAARARARQKRGGGDSTLALDEALAAVRGRADEMIAVDQALDRLGALNDRLRRVVELRFFADLSIEDTAEALGVTPRTVNRDWRKAKAFIHHELQATIGET